jgi:enoyl-[acyl-carrier protein] reductase III
VVSLQLASRYAHTVFVNYLQNDAEAERTRLMVEERGARAVLVRANLAEPDDIERIFETVKDQAGQLDILVHCAALNTFKPTLQVKPNQWDLTMNINARSFLLCVQRSVPLMKEGSIVAISSLGSQKAIPNYGVMGPTKSALESLVRYLAVELAPKGIRVNGVTGGIVETESIDKFPEAAKFREEAIMRTPAGRIGTPDDIANVVSFLVSPSAQWIVGQVIVADGGLLLV